MFVNCCGRPRDVEKCVTKFGLKMEIKMQDKVKAPTDRSLRDSLIAGEGCSAVQANRRGGVFWL